MGSLLLIERTHVLLDFPPRSIFHALHVLNSHPTVVFVPRQQLDTSAWLPFLRYTTSTNQHRQYILKLKLLLAFKLTVRTTEINYFIAFKVRQDCKIHICAEISRLTAFHCINFLLSQIHFWQKLSERNKFDSKMAIHNPPLKLYFSGYAQCYAVSSSGMSSGALLCILMTHFF